MIATIFLSLRASLTRTLAKHFRVGRRRPLALGLRAGRHIELDYAVVLVDRSLGGRVALPFLRHDVNERRTALVVAHVAQYGQQVIQIVPVDGADIFEAELFEQGAASDQSEGVTEGAVQRFCKSLRNSLRGPFPQIAHPRVGAARQATCKIGRHRADWRRYRHIVVIEDDDHALSHCAGVVHRLVGHARGHGAVADHADNVKILSRKIAGHCHTKASGNRGRRVSRAEGVVLTFSSARKTGKTAALAERADPVATARENLVRVGLMAHVPDDFVVGRVEEVVQRDREFDNAESGAEVSARHRHCIDRLATQFVRHLAQHLGLQLPQVVRQADHVEQWSGRVLRQSGPPQRCSNAPKPQCEGYTSAG